MLKIKHLTKCYGDKVAVNDINLHIQAGEIYGFIGHNGAGKTTTIKSCVGILKFDRGDVIINGTSIKENPIKCKSQIAYIPDNPDIYKFMTGIQYLDFISDVFHIPLRERKKKIRWYSDVFELTENLPDNISSYSHGMKQKLVIISALIHNPKLIILDEPFVGLDPKAAFILKKIMKELTAEGCSIFFSTHVLEVAQKLCDKVAIIKDGVLLKSGYMHDVIGDLSLEDVFLELSENIDIGYEDGDMDV